MRLASSRGTQPHAGPTPVPGDVVVLDNLPAHQVAGLAERVEAHGALEAVIRTAADWITEHDAKN